MVQNGIFYTYIQSLSLLVNKLTILFFDGIVQNDRLANVRVTVGETDTNFDDPPENEICDYLPGQPPADIFLVTCHTRMYGRYVRVTAVDVNDKFNFYELEIHGLEIVENNAID